VLFYLEINFFGIFFDSAIEVNPFQMVCVDFFYNYWGFLDKYIQDVDNPFQMVTHNGQNLTLTPGIAQQVAGLPALLPVRHHAANPHVNAQAGPSRNQVFFSFLFIF
jgi:hypothetical protein